MTVAVATSLAAACSTGAPPPTTATYLTPTRAPGARLARAARHPAIARRAPGGRRRARPGRFFERHAGVTAIDFDNRSEIRHWSLQIRATAGEGSSMPPAGGPSADERAMLVEWLVCGAP